jgi:hypothetical protein
VPARGHCLGPGHHVCRVVFRPLAHRVPT